MHLHWTEATNSFCRNDHYKNIFDVIWFDIIYLLIIQRVLNLLIMLQNFHPKNASLIILHVILKGFVMRNGNETKCTMMKDISFLLIIKMQRFVDFYYSNATLDEFWYFFSNLTRPSFRQTNTLKCRLASDNFMNWAIRSCHYYQALI